MCVTDTPETAIFHQDCLEDKEMNSVIPREVPDVVIYVTYFCQRNVFFKVVLICGIVLMLYK